MAQRLAKELAECRRWEGVRDLRSVERNVLRWEGLLLPNTPPYNMGAFRFELTFPPAYPLAPPCATLRTPIYHPAVDPHGGVCQTLTNHKEWKPTTRALQVLQDLLQLLDHLDPRWALRPELARELQDQPQVFYRKAEEHIHRHAEPRHGPPRTPEDMTPPSGSPSGTSGGSQHPTSCS
ncbi:ubiquitin/ISG15-conjugating enzyme E2 L6 [Heliangelus exortis]|uniref:ubiquitin/ISG15-conjugating enzyme E2 L6 n=1 Tax=Heliangelus exortis TaxID=472823 RepID=UPI003A908175